MMILRSTIGAAFLAIAAPALAQPFGPGPAGTVIGSSMADIPIGRTPAVGANRIQGAELFGDTAEERAVGRPYDDGRRNLRVRRTDPEGAPIELRAVEGRAVLDPLNSGVFARSGPTAIGASPVTRPALGARVPGRALIRRN